MDEVIVAVADSEPVAELIASRLRTEGIRARVRYDSQIGIPSQIAPAGLGLGLGAFRVAVAAEDASLAREIVADAEPQAYRPRPLLRAVSIVLLIAFVLSFVPGIIQLLAALVAHDR